MGKLMFNGKEIAEVVDWSISERLNINRLVVCNLAEEIKNKILNFIKKEVSPELNILKINLAFKSYSIYFVQEYSYYLLQITLNPIFGNQKQVWKFYFNMEGEMFEQTKGVK